MALVSGLCRRTADHVEREGWIGDGKVEATESFGVVGDLILVLLEEFVDSLVAFLWCVWLASEKVGHVGSGVTYADRFGVLSFEEPDVRRTVQPSHLEPQVRCNSFERERLLADEMTLCFSPCVGGPRFLGVGARID